MRLATRVERLEGRAAPAGGPTLQEMVTTLDHLSSDELDTFIVAGEQAQAGDAAAGRRRAALWALASDRRRRGERPRGREQSTCPRA